MDETSLISETEINPAKEDSNPGLVPKCKPPEKHGYVSQWVDLSVEQAVVSGAKLREKKPIVCNRQQNTIDLIDEDEDKKEKKSNKIRSVYKQQRLQRPIRPENCACTPRSCSPYQRLISSGTYSPLSKNIFSRPGTASSIQKARKPRKCPLRIAELAEPSKRHCIETWRSKNGALPPFMLDRLKQHVMNQRPIARIPDAINCFKRKPKCLTGSKREEKMLCRARAHAQREAQEMMDMKKFSAIFAQKLAKKLIKPMNISLSNEMEVLSNIVAIEINKIISNERTICVDYINDTVILKEMSSKVAIWIAGILDDAYYKLLEDDLRAKKHKENKQGKEGNLVTLIEKYILMRFEGHTDLEEEEGPALDVLETIVDKVVQLCTQTTEQDTNTDNTGSPDDGRSLGIGTEPDESIYDTGDSTTDKPDEAQASPSEQSTEKISTIIRSAQGLYDMPESTQGETTDEYDKKDDNNEEKDPTKLSTLELKGTEGEIKSLLNALLNEASLNVSEVFVVVSEDPLDEEKTVKFSKVDMEFGRRGITDSTTPYSGSSSPIRKSNIVFAPPKAALLYEADESWPGDVLKSKLPTTASVSKSVTSLGLIIESDEKNSNIVLSGKAEFDNDKTSSDNERYIKIIDGLERNKQGDDNERTLTPTDTSDDEDLYSTNRDTKNIDSLKGSEPSKNLDFKPDVNEHFKDDGKGDYDTDDDRNIMLEAIKQKMKLSYNAKPKFDYKVHPQTAPAWVTYNPSDDSIHAVSTSKKQIVAQAELRKWCRDLENTLINLQQWNNWIDETCKKMLSLKQETEMNNIFATDNNRGIKEWIKLKRNIDKDAILWRKLNKRTSEVLGSYTITFNPKTEDGDKAHDEPCIQESIFDTINMIDELSVWLHRLIVSTEYCVKCNCKKFSKRARKFCPNNKARC